MFAIRITALIITFHWKWMVWQTMSMKDIVITLALNPNFQLRPFYPIRRQTQK